MTYDCGCDVPSRYPWWIRWAVDEYVPGRDEVSILGELVAGVVLAAGIYGGLRFALWFFGLTVVQG